MNCHAWRHGNINAAKCSARIQAFELLIMAFGYWIRHHMPCFLSFTSWPCMRGRRSWKSLKSLLTLFAIGNFCAFLWVKIAIFCLNGDCAKGMSCMFIILIRFIASNLNFTTNSPQSIDFSSRISFQNAFNNLRSSHDIVNRAKPLAIKGLTSFAFSALNGVFFHIIFVLCRSAQCKTENFICHDKS